VKWLELELVLLGVVAVAFLSPVFPPFELANSQSTINWLWAGLAEGDVLV
jgi:hypothetical protein